MELNRRTNELRAAGLDVINMTAGEPDFTTPYHIIAAAKKALDDGYTRYTPVAGLSQLREAVTVKLKRDNNVAVDPNQVIVSSGGKHSLFNACMALFQQGDEVIIFSPYWVSFPELVNLAHATPVIVGTDPERQFEPLFDELESKITSRTKGIIANSPSNPSGGVWSRTAMERIIDVAQQHDLWLFSDESYEAFAFDVPFESPASLAPDFDKILTFQSCSKTYAMSGWRIGYMAGPREVVAAMTKIQSQSTSCTNAISQVAAIAALTGDQSVVIDFKNTFMRRRDLIVEKLSQIPYLSCRNPGGAFYTFLDVSELFGKVAEMPGNPSKAETENRPLRNPQDISEYLLNQALVATVNGEGFGDGEHIRLSFVVSQKDIRAAIERISTAVTKLR